MARVLAGATLLGFGIAFGVVMALGPGATPSATAAAPSRGPATAVVAEPARAARAPTLTVTALRTASGTRLGTVTGACPPGTVQNLVTERSAYSAEVIDQAVVYRKPGRGPIATLGRFNINGFPTTFGVLKAIAGKKCVAAWLQVSLPMRPNGAVGYIRNRDVWLRRIDTRIVVDLSARRVSFYKAGRRLVHARAAIGKHETPTPRGRYYVNQKLVPSDASGPFGPAAIGVSAFSPVLTGWAQGGPIGIHGTNQPNLLGQRVSNGCIRLHNSVITRLFELTPAGTPVIIQP